MDSGPVALAVSLDLAEIGTRKYIRLWIYARNNSDTTLDLVPQRQVWVQGLGDESQNVAELFPSTPTDILQHIEDEKIQAQSMAFIGGLLASIGNSLSTQDTEADINVQSGASAKRAAITFHDAPDKVRARQDRLNVRMASSNESMESFYSGLKSAIAVGCLRRNTLDPGASANGYVYFDYGRPQTVIHFAHGRTRVISPTPDELSYTVRLTIGNGPQVQVEFLANEGE